MTQWIIPSAHWRDEVLLLRELLDLTMPAAWALLQQYGSAEAAFENYTCEKSSST